MITTDVHFLTACVIRRPQPINHQHLRCAGTAARSAEVWTDKEPMDDRYARMTALRAWTTADARTIEDTGIVIGEYLFMGLIGVHL